MNTLTHSADACTTLMPICDGRLRFHSAFGGHSIAMIIEGSMGEARLYRDYQPVDEIDFRPGTWWGSESRVDQQGRSWSSSVGRLVCDDFGNLVEVPA
ncbi:hypothetical protein SAMN05216344_106103 [Polaromonas sp. OV174]|uniref:hypothetical protein n=1 Tax=Polaromonas sp. OV174 TaxID=1855300 RepID=UPI0008DFB114|nr:hypothetical protein [Polaromonas sp. OV174]SFB96186.1 hypothetical protein SAMN05216344_106103 [Polaromonas sp. OV174]